MQKNTSVNSLFETETDLPERNKCPVCSAPEDWYYYNSDLNWYVGKTLPPCFTFIDMDVFSLKRDKKIMRVGEYKHSSEGMKPSQKEALERMAEFARVANKHPDLFEGWKFEVVIIRSNLPFDTATIQDLTTNKIYNTWDRNTFDKWIKYEIPTEELDCPESAF